MTETKVAVALPERAYDIWIGALESASLRSAAGRFGDGRRVLLVADSHTAAVLPRVEPLFAGAAATHRFVFPAGEASKNFATAAAICGEAARCGCDRDSLLVAVGGGVTGDLTGFAAAIFMRGVDFVQVPTSLLAMVDSSVGGKTGVDLPEGKNLAGAFHQPRTVLIDPRLLATLPRRERIGAMAEIVKYGVIGDAEFFAGLERDADRFDGPFDPELFAGVIRRCCACKAATVIADEREQGCRALLNYGHTFGHAAELLSEFRLSHGEAVAIGMAVAGALARRLDRWSAEAEARQRALLVRLGLPVRLPRAFSVRAMLDAMAHDKKTRGGRLHFVLPDGIGSASVCRDAAPEAVAAAMEDCYD